jgi:hypothetical protein
LFLLHAAFVFVFNLPRERDKDIKEEKNPSFLGGVCLPRMQPDRMDEWR